MTSALLLLCAMLSAGLAQASEQRVSWDAPAPVEAVTITGYSLQSCVAPVGSPTCQPLDLVGEPLPATPRTFTFTGLLPGRTYCFTGVTLGTGAKTPRSTQSVPCCFVAPTDLPGALLPPQNLRAGGS